MSNAYSSQRDFESGPCDEKPEEPSHRSVDQRSVWVAQCDSLRHSQVLLLEPLERLTAGPSSSVESSSCAKGTALRSSEPASEPEGANLFWATSLPSHKKNNRHETKHTWKLFEKNITMKQAMEFNFPNVQTSDTLFAPRSTLRAAPEKTLENCEFDPLHLLKKYIKQQCTCSPSQCCMCERTQRATQQASLSKKMADDLL